MRQSQPNSSTVISQSNFASSASWHFLSGCLQTNSDQLMWLILLWTSYVFRLSTSAFHAHSEGSIWNVAIQYDSIGSWFAGKWHLHLAFQSFHQGTEFSQTATKTVKTSSCLDSFCQVSCPSNPPWNLSSSAHPSQNCTQLQHATARWTRKWTSVDTSSHYGWTSFSWRSLVDRASNLRRYSDPMCSAFSSGGSLRCEFVCKVWLLASATVRTIHQCPTHHKDQPLQQPTRMEQLWIMQHFREISKTRVNNGKQRINMAKRQTPMIRQPLIDVHFSQQRWQSTPHG